eukprot:TRINITY_DN4641_c0_g1_i1.p1 TRINITY_DN4641_c0_g1~~TRINITY_DN4641_c0_g1_i1.p1  ORF type:complete len:460 (+),score=148.41 TRINITY_DN4641_c0_g1_i1:64-1380(+)
MDKRVSKKEKKEKRKEKRKEASLEDGERSEVRVCTVKEKKDEKMSTKKSKKNKKHKKSDKIGLDDIFSHGKRERKEKKRLNEATKEERKKKKIKRKHKRTKLSDDVTMEEDIQRDSMNESDSQDKGKDKDKDEDLNPVETLSSDGLHTASKRRPKLFLGDRTGEVDKETLEVWKKSGNVVASGTMRPREEELILHAMKEYFKEQGISEESGFGMLFSIPIDVRLRGIYKHINTYLPHRTFQTIYEHVWRTFSEDGENVNWTEIDDKQLLDLQKELGNDWREIAKRMKRLNVIVKDRFKFLKNTQKRRGIIDNWTSEELQNLKDLVEKTHRPGSRIQWSILANSFPERSGAELCAKWKKIQRENLTKTKEWGEGEDFELAKRLWHCGSDREEDVMWSAIFSPYSPSFINRKWKMMCREYGAENMSFGDAIEVVFEKLNI